MKEKILVVGANPAWQKVLQFEKIDYNEVNRAFNSITFSSGKGINFSRALKIHNCYEPLLVQFLAGDNGKKIEAELQKESILQKNVTLGNGETRCCTTCLSIEDKKMTELIEPSPKVLEDEAIEFEKLVIDNLNEVKSLAICGTLPKDVNAKVYLNITKKALQLNQYVLIDSYMNIDSLLANSQGKIILKINVEELLKLTKKNDVIEALNMLNSQYSLAFCAITNGANPAYLSVGGKIYTLRLPATSKYVNPIGCGDTNSAILLAEYLKSNNALSAFKLALGAATSNLMSLKCAEFDLDFAKKYAQEIAVELL